MSQEPEVPAIGCKQTTRNAGIRGLGEPFGTHLERLGKLLDSQERLLREERLRSVDQVPKRLLLTLLLLVCRRECLDRAVHQHENGLLAHECKALVGQLIVHGHEVVHGVPE